MERGELGRRAVMSLTSEHVEAFVPMPLPPNPPIDMSGQLKQALESASLALGRLDGIAFSPLLSVLPDPLIFAYAYRRKEAVLSSQIEGTQTSLADLALFEAGAPPDAHMDDAIETANYAAALEHGMARMEEGFPICNRLIREIHAILLSSGRGQNKTPGAFRRSQNWIGGTRPGNAVYVPPPPDHVEECMADLERFIHADDGLPTLIRAGVAHLQFEMIHPFLDGNGRVGRLLILLMLMDAGALRSPVLYLSLYLKRHTDQYYRLLNETKNTGDWETWIAFFLKGVQTSAEEAVETCNRLFRLFADDRALIESEIGRRAGSALRVHRSLCSIPAAQLTVIAKRAEISYGAASSAVKALEKIGIVSEVTGKRRGRVYVYTRCLNILNEDTEPL